MGGFVAGRASAAQPHMNAALDHLKLARRELNAALADKGGHREKAIALVKDAITEVEAGIEAGRIRFADEQRIECRGDSPESRLDIARRQREVQARYVTTCAAPPIALEGLAVEQILALGDLGG